MSVQDALRQQLFAGGDLHTYAIVDGASVDNLLPTLAATALPEQVCLYRGELDAELLAAAPHLLKLPADHPFTDWLLQGWGRHWGIFLQSRASLRELRKHFRTVLIVRDPDNKPLYFRYYDPRVLRVFLPTCNAGELAQVFGPVERYLLEDEDPGRLLVYARQGAALGTDIVHLALPDPS